METAEIIKFVIIYSGGALSGFLAGRGWIKRLNKQTTPPSEERKRRESLYALEGSEGVVDINDIRLAWSIPITTDGFSSLTMTNKGNWILMKVDRSTPYDKPALRLLTEEEKKRYKGLMNREDEVKRY